MLAPYDHDDRRTAWLHRGARPAARPVPDWLVPLGPTVGWPSNGAVSNLAPHADGVARLRRELRSGQFDVVHLHEPVTPDGRLGRAHLSRRAARWHLPLLLRGAPPHAVATLLGARRKLNHLRSGSASPRPPPGPAGASTAASYRVVPNGVELPAGGVPAPRLRAPGEPLEIVFVGQAVERKGLPILLRAFEALREHVPARLTSSAPPATEVAPMLVEQHGVTVLGRVSDAEKHAALEAAHVLAAPSLGGESFGMVLTEAFAAATPVVASDIAGYRDVVERRRRRPARPARRRHRARRDAARARARPRAHAARSATPPRERGALRLAEGRRPGRRGATTDARAVPQPEGAMDRPRSASASARRTSTRAARRSGCRRSSRCPRCRAGPARCSPGGLAAAALGRRGGPYLALEPSASTGSAARSSLQPRLGARRPGAHVPLHGFRAVSWHAILKAALPTRARASATPGRAPRSAC